MSEAPEEVAPKPSGLGSMRRKAVETTELVQTSLMGEGLLPLVARPSMDGVDLAAWAASHRDEIDGWYDKHGAILFRGFALTSVEDFEGVASANRRRPVQGIRRPAAGVGEPGGLRRDAVSGRQDDPLPQRELAPADVADASVLLLRHSVGDGWNDPAPRLPGGVQRDGPGDPRRVRDEGTHVRPELLRGHRRPVAGVLPHRRQGRGRADLRRGRHDL